jgi:IS5 family transposase
MENRNRILMGIGVELFVGSTGEQSGGLSLIGRTKRRLRLRPKTIGGDRGYFAAAFMQGLLDRSIKPHIAALGYQISRRARKRIEELWGEGKEYHGLRRFSRRGLERVRQEAHLIGWLLNLKRLATLSAPA